MCFSGSKFSIAPGAGVNRGFEGCISDLKVGNYHSELVDFTKDVIDSSNVKDCSILNGCMNCQNGGSCIPGDGYEFICSCPKGFR